MQLVHGPMLMVQLRGRLEGRGPGRRGGQGAEEGRGLGRRRGPGTGEEERTGDPAGGEDQSNLSPMNPTKATTNTVKFPNINSAHPHHVN